MATLIKPYVPAIGKDYEQAHEYINELQKNNEEMKEIITLLQPLLYELSLALYKDDDKTIQLNQLIEEATNWVKAQEEK